MDWFVVIKEYLVNQRLFVAVGNLLQLAPYTVNWTEMLLHADCHFLDPPAETVLRPPFISGGTSVLRREEKGHRKAQRHHSLHSNQKQNDKEKEQTYEYLSRASGLTKQETAETDNKGTKISQQEEEPNSAMLNNRDKDPQGSKFADFPQPTSIYVTSPGRSDQ